MKQQNWIKNTVLPFVDRVGVSRLNAFLLVVIVLIIPIIAITADDRLLLYIPQAIPHYCQSHYTDFASPHGGAILFLPTKAERMQACIDDKGVVPPEPTVNPFDQLDLL